MTSSRFRTAPPSRDDEPDGLARLRRDTTARLRACLDCRPGAKERPHDLLRTIVADLVGALPPLGLPDPDLRARVVLAECLADVDAVRPEQALAVLALPGAAREGGPAAGLPVAAYGVAAAARLLQATWSRAAERHSLGGPLTGQQAVRFRLAALSAEVDGVRRLLRAALHVRCGGGAEAEPTAAAACVRAARLLRRAADECLHLHGASGHVEDHPAQRLLVVSHRLPAPRAAGDALLAALLDASTASAPSGPTAVEPGPTAELTGYRARVQDVVERNPAVFAAANWDDPERQPPGRQAVALLGDAGLLAHAGAGADRDVPRAVMFSAVLHEALAMLPAGAVVLTHTDVATRLLASFSKTAADARHAAAGRMMGALAVTEPGGGLDFDAMATTVRPDGDGLLLDGEKWFSSNAPFADELLVLARDTRFPGTAVGRHTLLRVPVRAPGVAVTPLRTLGHRGLTGHIALTRVPVGTAAVLGAPGTGLLSLMKHWVHERVMLAVRMTAMAGGLLTALVTALSSGSGPSLADTHVARLCTGLLAAVTQERAACRQALTELGAGQCAPHTAAGCKLRAAALLRRVAATVIRLETDLAAADPDFPALSPAEPGLAERVLRDGAGLGLAGGSDEALLMVLSRSMR